MHDIAQRFHFTLADLVNAAVHSDLAAYVDAYEDGYFYLFLLATKNGEIDITEPDYRPDIAELTQEVKDKILVIQCEPDWFTTVDNHLRYTHTLLEHYLLYTILRFEWIRTRMNEGYTVIHHIRPNDQTLLYKSLELDEYDAGDLEVEFIPEDEGDDIDTLM